VTEEKKDKDGVLKVVGRCFIVGLFAFLPLLITVGVIVWAVDFISGLLGPETLLGGGLKGMGLTVVKDGNLAYGIGWGVVLILIFCVGVIFQMGAKKYLQSQADKMLCKVPVLGSVYGTARQVVDMMDTQAEAELKQMAVVYCTLGKENGTILLGLRPSPDQYRVNGIDYYAVIIPTAPVPFGGGLLFVPVDNVLDAEMSVDALMSIYVSMGISAPQFMPPGGDGAAK
jgi:uncharacterized membrane protein